MGRGITESDVQCAEILFRARRADSDIVGALVYRGLSSEAASGLLDDLKADKEIRVCLPKGDIVRYRDLQQRRAQRSSSAGRLKEQQAVHSRVGAFKKLLVAVPVSVLSVVLLSYLSNSGRFGSGVVLGLVSVKACKLVLLFPLLYLQMTLIELITGLTIEENERRFRELRWPVRLVVGFFILVVSFVLVVGGVYFVLS